MAKTESSLKKEKRPLSRKYALDNSLFSFFMNGFPLAQTNKAATLIHLLAKSAVPHLSS